MGIIAVVVDTALRNDDGSSRAGAIRRHCSVGRSVELRRTSDRTGANSIAVYLRVPRFFGLLGSRMTQIGFVDAAATAAISKKGPSEETRATVKSVYAPQEKDSPLVTIMIE